MHKNRIVLALVFIVCTVASRLLFSPWDHNGFSFDEGNLALAARSYSIQESRPHLPGYYAHVAVIRFFSRITGEIFSSMSLVSALYSGCAAGLFFLLLIRWFSLPAALCMTVLLMTNPVVWFYGCSSEIYAFDLFLGIAGMYLGTTNRLIYFLPLLFAGAAGVRQSSPVLLIPLYCYLWFRFHRDNGIDMKKFLVYHFFGVVLCGAWFIPMIYSTGGFQGYLDLYVTNNPVEGTTLLQSIYRMASFCVYFCVQIVVVVAATLCIPKTGKQQSPQATLYPVRDLRSLLILLGLWIVPPFLFFLFVAYSKGYILLIAGGISIATCLIMYRRAWGVVLCMALIGMQTLFFLAYPCTSPDVEVFIASQYRTIKPLKVWRERMNSVFCMSQSQLRAQTALDRHLERIAKEMEQEKPGGWYDARFLFIDPTSTMSARALQAKHPKTCFASLQLRKKNAYVTYGNLAYRERAGIDDLVSSSLIFSRTDFVRRYFAGAAIEQKTFGEWTLFRFCSSSLEDGAQKYATLFLR